MRALILAGPVLAAVALAGCTNPDAPGATGAPGTTRAAAAPQNPGEPAAPQVASQSASQPQPTPQRALNAFAVLYVNWSFRTLTAAQRTLAQMSVGAARLAETQAAVSSAADRTIREGHIHNSGQVVSIAPNAARTGAWVIVTREQTGGSSQYQGLPPAYHVTLARLAQVPGGYAVSQWLPQS